MGLQNKIFKAQRKPIVITANRCVCGLFWTARRVQLFISGLQVNGLLKCRQKFHRETNYGKKLMSDVINSNKICLIRGRAKNRRVRNN